MTSSHDPSVVPPADARPPAFSTPAFPTSPQPGTFATPGPYYPGGPSEQAPYYPPQFGPVQGGGTYHTPANAKTNGMAISALILGLSGFLLITACVGMGLGFGALGTVKRTDQPGKGLAIAGIVLSGAWLLFWLIFFIAA